MFANRKLSGVIRANRFARFARIRRFARIGNSSGSGEFGLTRYKNRGPPKPPPLKSKRRNFTDMVFPAERTIFPGVHKIGTAISGPRIADKNFADTKTIFLINCESIRANRFARIALRIANATESASVHSRALQKEVAVCEHNANSPAAPTSFQQWHELI